MIQVDEDALICDLAETYHIYRYRSLPCSLVATFSVGLRENSRIKLKLGGLKASVETLLLARIVDNTALSTWLNTKDGLDGTNRPESVFDAIQNAGERKERDFIVFQDAEDFERMRAELLRKGHEWQQN